MFFLRTVQNKTWQVFKNGRGIELLCCSRFILIPQIRSLFLWLPYLKAFSWCTQPKKFFSDRPCSIWLKPSSCNSGITQSLVLLLLLLYEWCFSFSFCFKISGLLGFQEGIDLILSKLPLFYYMEFYTIKESLLSSSFNTFFLQGI